MSSPVMSLNTKLSKPTSFFGLQLWIVILLCIGIVVIIFLLIFISLCIFSIRRRRSKPIGGARNYLSRNYTNTSLDSSRLLSRDHVSDIEMMRPEYHVMIPNQWSSHGTSNNVNDLESSVAIRSPMLVIRRGDRFTLREIEVATDGFSDGNVIGSGDYGIVYRGVLLDSTRVAVKKLWSYRCQAEDFKLEIEAIGHVRHKNLVKLLGYCIDGAHRMLVYEYIDNGNLQEWLHGCIGKVSPLTWSMRMKIISGTAKGLAYLHEDVEPKLVHQNIKSSNIQLDCQWNAKLSDFGLAKLFDPEGNHLAARAMTPSGYAAPGNASSGVVCTEKSDVYSFGILIMEIVSGRTPIDYNQPQVEVFLIDWLKVMVANHKCDHVVDPKMPEMPSSKELKRVLLIALRCVDPDVKSRPKMGDVMHMLEPRDLLLNDEQVMRRDSFQCNQREKTGATKLDESDSDKYEGESSCSSSWPPGFFIEFSPHSSN